MALPSSAIVTAPTGPGLSVTAQTIQKVTSIEILPAPRSVMLIQGDGKTYSFDLAATTTVTATISAGVIALTVSQ